MNDELDDNFISSLCYLLLFLIFWTIWQRYTRIIFHWQSPWILLKSSASKNEPGNWNWLKYCMQFNINIVWCERNSQCFFYLICNCWEINFIFQYYFKMINLVRQIVIQHFVPYSFYTDVIVSYYELYCWSSRKLATLNVFMKISFSNNWS